MIYSVYNIETKLYDYFEGAGPTGTHAGTPPIVNSHDLGATVESAGWRLPMGARRVGNGPLPRGRVASGGGGGALGEFTASPVGLAIVGLVAYLAWNHTRRRKS